MVTNLFNEMWSTDLDKQKIRKKYNSIVYQKRKVKIVFVLECITGRLANTSKLSLTGNSNNISGLQRKMFYTSQTSWVSVRNGQYADELASQ